MKDNRNGSVSKLLFVNRKDVAMDDKGKRKNIFLGSIKKYGVHILFGICAYLTIRWSDLPAPQIKILEILFVHKKDVDAAALNTITGYITGYMVYVLTVLLPDSKRKKPIRALVIERLAVLYQKSVYVLLLMCKNCCENEGEWKKILKSTDLECFNEKFFSCIKRFDMTSNADTIFSHREDETPLKWYEYLHEKYDDTYKELETLFMQYQYYLSNEDLEVIYTLKNSEYLDAFSGKGQRMLNFVNSAEDQYGYYDDFPLQMFYAQPNKMSPIFADIEGVENSKMIKDYVEVLKETYKYLDKYKKKYGLEILHEDYACSKLKEKNIGHLGTAIFK